MGREESKTYEKNFDEQQIMDVFASHKQKLPEIRRRRTGDGKPQKETQNFLVQGSRMSTGDT